MNRTTSRISTALIGIGLLGTLAACSSADAPKPSPTPSASTPAAFTPTHNECDTDGFLDIAGGSREEFGDCRVISLMADGRTVTVGDSEELYFEGSGNTIHAGTVGKVDFLSTSGNTLTYTGAAPEVLNQGENTVTAEE